MNCESARKQFSLYLYGELSFEDDELVASHLDDCEACRRELEREKRLHRALDVSEIQVPAELLARCRMALPRTLNRSGTGARGAGWLSRLRRFASDGGWNGLLRPAGAVALVAIGFFAARFNVVPTGDDLVTGVEPVETSVRYVEPVRNGRVRIVVDETRERVLSGSMDDQAIRHMLLNAVRNPTDPGVRADSLELLTRSPASPDTRDALFYALEHDPNDGVRLKAIEGLRAYPSDRRCRGLLSRVLLNEHNPGIRSMAIDLLVRTGETDVVATLQQLLRREDNSALRMRTERVLEKMNASVETF